MGVFANVKRIWNMGKEIDDLKEAVALIGVAVEEGVTEIHKLADQLAVCAATPMVPDDAAMLNESAMTLRGLADRLHKAVFPPSSSVPLEAPKAPEEGDTSGSA